MEIPFCYQFRLILIGDSTVGKSSLLKSFTDSKFSEASDPTVGVDFFAHLIEVADGTRIKLQCWDTGKWTLIAAFLRRYSYCCLCFAAGQERFRSITKSYYRNSVGVLLIYDVTNHASFEHIPLWMMEAKRHIEPHLPVFALIGCKLDLISNGARREVSQEEAKSFAEQHNLHFMETSSRTGVNVREAFQAVTQEIYNRIQSGEYRIEDGWDGIKAGFPRPSSLEFNYVMAEPAKSTCC